MVRIPEILRPYGAVGSLIEVRARCRRIFLIANRRLEMELSPVKSMQGSSLIAKKCVFSSEVGPISAAFSSTRRFASGVAPECPPMAACRARGCRCAAATRVRRAWRSGRWPNAGSRPGSCRARRRHGIRRTSGDRVSRPPARRPAGLRTDFSARALSPALARLREALRARRAASGRARRPWPLPPRRTALVQWKREEGLLEAAGVSLEHAPQLVIDRAAHSLDFVCHSPAKQKAMARAGEAEARGDGEVGAGGQLPRQDRRSIVRGAGKRHLFVGPEPAVEFHARY